MSPATHVGLSWFWLGVAVVAPTVLVLLIAAPIWWKGDPAVGNVVGTGVVGLSIVLLILREISLLVSLRVDCSRKQIPCHIVPDDFTRSAIYAGIGFADLMVLFVASLWFEERRRRRRRAPEWR